MGYFKDNQIGEQQEKNTSGQESVCKVSLTDKKELVNIAKRCWEKDLISTVDYIIICGKNHQPIF